MLPIRRKAYDFFSGESRLAGPVHVPWVPAELVGGDAPGRICTDTGPGLSRLPLLVGLREQFPGLGRMVPAAGVAPALAPF